MHCAQLVFTFLACLLIASAAPGPDSGRHVPLPGPGLSYGGIPYGSMSGNVAAYFKQQPPLPNGRSLNFAHNNLDYSPIQQYL